MTCTQKYALLPLWRALLNMQGTKTLTRKHKTLLDKKNHAASVIQDLFRQKLLSKWQAYLSYHATVIQRAFRSYATRLQNTRNFNINTDLQRLKFHDKSATQIQKMWRGYWSRKTKFSIKTHKEYLSNVAKNAKAMRKILAVHEEHQKRLYFEAKREKEIERQKKLLQKFHYFAGTNFVVPPIKLKNKFAATSNVVDYRSTSDEFLN